MGLRWSLRPFLSYHVTRATHLPRVENSRMPLPRVVLADDHPAVLAQVKTILSTDFDIVDAVSDGEAAVTAVRRLAPDAVILDI